MRAFRAALLELQLCQLPETNWGTSALRMIPRGWAVSICNQHHCRPCFHHGDTNIGQHIQHKPTKFHENFNVWWPKEQGLTAGLFLQLTTLPQVKNCHLNNGKKKKQLKNTSYRFPCMECVELGIIHLKRCVYTNYWPCLLFILLCVASEKTCQILWPCDKSCIPPRCHSNAHSCACFAGAWHINDQKHLCHHHYGWLVGQKLTQVPLVNI